MFVFLILIPAQIVAWVGMFRSRSWARWLYLALVIVTNCIVILLSISDFSMQWGLVTSVEDLGSYCAGAILALAFLSPMAKLFRGVGVQR